MLGFAGEIASGKGTATDLVKSWYPGTPSVRFSDSLREFLSWFNKVKSLGLFADDDRRCLPYYLKGGLCGVFPEPLIQEFNWEQFVAFAEWVREQWILGLGEVKEDRHNLQALSTALRSLFAENILERTVVERIAQTKTESPLAIIEGIRRLVDIGTLLGESNFRLIYLEIDPVVAHARMVKRAENVGDSEMTIELFMELREAEAEQQIRSLKPHAHLVIDNGGTPEMLQSQLRSEVSKWLVR